MALISATKPGIALSGPGDEPIVTRSAVTCVG